MKDRILAIDTGAESCSAALSVEGQLYQRYEPTPREHSKFVLPMVDSLLQESGLKLADLNGIAYIRGPGSFTGLRIGVSVVQGLAYAANLPTLGLSSLHCLAASALETYSLQPSKTLLVMLDARMNEVYWAQYRVEQGRPSLVGQESVGKPEHIIIDGDSGLVGLGSGWNYQAQLSTDIQTRLEEVYPEHNTRATDIFSLLEFLGDEAEPFGASSALPVYVRNKVSWKKLSEQKKIAATKREMQH
jgi:tRNA threonylcarbamoyladenosine biosynthesis protein TsaB